MHLSVPSDNVVINNTHSYSSRYQRIHTFPDDPEREAESEYQEPSALLHPRDRRDSTGGFDAPAHPHTSTRPRSVETCTLSFFSEKSSSMRKRLRVRPAMSLETLSGCVDKSIGTPGHDSDCE